MHSPIWTIQQWPLRHSILTLIVCADAAAVAVTGRPSESFALLQYQIRYTSEAQRLNDTTEI